MYHCEKPLNQRVLCAFGSLANGRFIESTDSVSLSIHVPLTLRVGQQAFRLPPSALRDVGAQLGGIFHRSRIGLFCINDFEPTDTHRTIDFEVLDMNVYAVVHNWPREGFEYDAEPDPDALFDGLDRMNREFPNAFLSFSHVEFNLDEKNNFALLSALSWTKLARMAEEMPTNDNPRLRLSKRVMQLMRRNNEHQDGGKFFFYCAAYDIAVVILEAAADNLG